MGTKETYHSLLKQLYRININHPVKLGLENTLEMFYGFGKPTSKIPTIHIAGTNGKGSVAVKIAESLKLAGIKTGLFTSPHISSFRERIKIDSEMISENEFQEIFNEIVYFIDQKNIPATFFEISTIMSLLHFERNNCDAIVLEVGIGGRLDSTNIVSPSLSIITSIQMDHSFILGDTIEKIALEKAGIMKKGVEVLVGRDCPLDLLKSKASEVGSPFYTIDDILDKNQLKYDSSGSEIQDVDDLNSDIAKSALILLKRNSNQEQNNVFSKINDLNVEGITCRPTCRFELIKVSCENRNDVISILDIAHNPDAMTTLIKKMNKYYPNKKFRVVLGLSADKDVSKLLDILLSQVSSDRIHCVAANTPRALSSEELNLKIFEKTNMFANIHHSVTSGINQAILFSKNDDSIVLVCGTSFIMAEARKALGIVEPRDADVLTSGTNDGIKFCDGQESFNTKNT